MKSNNVGDTICHCELCGKELKKKSLARHMREIHPKQDNSVTCPHCQKNFSRRSNLIRHIESNHSETLTESSGLSDEGNVVKIKEKKYQCDECGVSFRQKSHYNEHLQIHQGQRFECSQCDKSFSRLTTLKSHIQSAHPSSTRAESNHIQHGHNSVAIQNNIEANTCKSIAFLPHGGHVDVVHNCGIVSCRDASNASQLLTEDRSRLSSYRHNHPLPFPPDHNTLPEEIAHHMDHSNCTKVGYVLHDNHADFLYSCGSLLCNDEEVDFGEPPRIQQNLYPFTTECATSDADHSSCRNVAYLSHDGHVDFLRCCGNVTCRDENNICTTSDKRKESDSYEKGVPLPEESHVVKKSRHSTNDNDGDSNYDHRAGSKDEGFSTHEKHMGCAKVAYMKHEDHVDILHSCGSLLCHDEEVPFGEAPRTNDNLRAFEFHDNMTNGSVDQHTDHSTCKNVAYLPHDGHIDFLRSCGNVSCRNDGQTEQAPNNEVGRDSAHLNPSNVPPSSRSANDTSAVNKEHVRSHISCTKVACLKHDDHIDYLHSCGSLFCRDQEVELGQAPHTHENLCEIDEDIVNIFS